MSSLAHAAAPRLRQGLLWLAGLTLVGIAIEMAVERHWTQPSQWIAWAALAVAALAAALVSWRPSAGGVRLARILAFAVIASAAVGIWQHIASNYDAGPLDAEYT